MPTTRQALLGAGIASMTAVDNDPINRNEQARYARKSNNKKLRSIWCNGAFKGFETANQIYSIPDHIENKSTHVPLYKINEDATWCKGGADKATNMTMRSIFLSKMVPVSKLQKCGPQKAHLSVQNILGEWLQWQAVQREKSHLLKRDTADAGGAVLD